MTTWQSRLLGERYDLIFVEPPATLEASAFWPTIKQLCPPSSLILLSGSHARMASFLAENLVRFYQAHLCQI